VTLHCWKPGGHGALTLEEALAHSCNVAFMQIGERAGLEAIRGAARKAGLSVSARGALLQTAIGEGPGVAATPRQMAGFVGAIATGGPLRAPSWQPEFKRGAPLASEATLARLRKGMAGSVVFGSSRKAATGKVAIAGKTGTSTYLDGTNRTYGWFVGYAPVQHPRVVVVVFLKHANGFAAAAPLGRQVVEAWDQAGQP
jgi:cell division protein FtsI/penicillin-binding protein 2